ncbi:MAG: hypothetical protein ACRC92_20480 [Peptostreptococcaceae bacterium]
MAKKDKELSAQPENTTVVKEEVSKLDTPVINKEIVVEHEVITEEEVVPQTAAEPHIEEEPVVDEEVEEAELSEQEFYDNYSPLVKMRANAAVNEAARRKREYALQGMEISEEVYTSASPAKLSRVARTIMETANPSPEDEGFHEFLLNSRDYYRVYMNHGEPLPLFHLKHFTSPKEPLNLDLEDVLILANDGFFVENKRTGDIVKARNVNKYVANWSKDKSPIL